MHQNWTEKHLIEVTHVVSTPKINASNKKKNNLKTFNKQIINLCLTHFSHSFQLLYSLRSLYTESACLVRKSDGFRGDVTSIFISWSQQCSHWPV